MRKVLAIPLVISLAMLGCTMNRTPGNGQPVISTPYMSPASTPGSSSGNVPMTSSYISTNSNARLAADEAAALMREHQAYRGRFLGYLNPTPMVQQVVPDMQTGQVIPPALYANPQVTVNSSISSQPTPVIGNGAIVASGSAVTTGTATTATTAAATIGTTGTAAVTPTTANVTSGTLPSALAAGT